MISDTCRFLRRYGLVMVISLFFPLLVNGANVAVTAVVSTGGPPTPGPTKVIFRGLAYPSSQVTIMRQGAVLVTIPADPSARFDVEVTVTPGIATYSVFAEDNQGRVGRTTNFTLSISEGTTTTVSGIFLGPTIEIDQTNYRLGDTVTVLGTTAPGSAVTIYVASEEEKTFSTRADGTGLWVLQQISDTYGIGTHSARAKAVSTANDISGFSGTVSFSVTAKPPQPCDGKRPGDLNCDGKVNLTDFSILLFFWKKSNPSNTRADINKDGIVNIRDLSILLFWWTGNK